MTARDRAKLSAGDRLTIKKGYVGFGLKATFVSGSDSGPYLCVILPGSRDPVMRHQTMFSMRTPAQEVTRESIS